MIECVYERRRKTREMESRLFIFFDKDQLDDADRTVKFKAKTSYDFPLLNADESFVLESWGRHFLKCISHYNYAELNKFAQCFLSAYSEALTTRNIKSSRLSKRPAWPIPTLNSALNYAQITDRLNFIVRLHLLAHGIQIVPSESDKNIYNQLAHFSEWRNPYWLEYNNETDGSRDNDADRTHNIWRVKKITFYVWGKFVALVDKWSLTFEPTATILCGLSNSGKTTVLLALETVCFIMTNGCDASTGYRLHEDSSGLPQEIREKLLTLFEYITKQNISYYEKKRPTPIFKVVFEDQFQKSLTFNLEVDTTSGKAFNFCYELLPRTIQQAIAREISAEIECGDHVCSLSNECNKLGRPSSVDELFEPLVRLKGYNLSIDSVLTLLSWFYPTSDVRIMRREHFGIVPDWSTDDCDIDDYCWWEEPNDAILMSMGEIKKPTGRLSAFGDGFVHILRIIVKSLTLQYQTTIGPKLLLLDEPDRSVDRPTLALLVEFLTTKLHSSIQCVVATHAYEIIAHSPDARNIGVRYFSQDQIMECNFEGVLRSLHCADTFSLMRYFPLEKVLYAFLLENESDKRFICAVISVFGTSEQQKKWDAQCYSIFYSRGRAANEKAEQISDKLAPVLSQDSSTKKIEIFALVDQDINLQSKLDAEEKNWKFSFYRWKRRCLESYLFDNIDALDEMAASNDKKKPREVLFDPDHLHEWYDSLVLVTKGEKRKQTEGQQSQSTTELAEATSFQLDVENKLKEYSLPPLSTFNPYEEVIRNATITFCERLNSPQPDHIKWFESKGVTVNTELSFRVHIMNAVKSAMNKRSPKKVADTEAEKWFNEKKILYPWNDKLLEPSERKRLLYWVDAHSVVTTLKSHSGVDLKRPDNLEDLFRKRLRNEVIDEGVKEIKKMLSEFFQWLPESTS